MFGSGVMDVDVGFVSDVLYGVVWRSQGSHSGAWPVSRPISAAGVAEPDVVMASASL